MLRTRIVIAIALLILLILILIAGISVLWYRKFPIHLIYKSKRHLEAMFDSMESPVAIIESDFSIKRVNRSYAVLVKKGFLDILDQKCFSVLRGRNSPCEDCKLNQVLHSGKTEISGNSPHPHMADGVMEFIFYPFNKKHHGAGVIVEHIRDITQLDRLRRQLQVQYEALEQTTLKLREAWARTEEELKIARQIQLGIMPKQIPEIKGLRIDAMYHSIEEVGGDLYDFILFPGGKLGLFIGDASGHGIASSYIGTISKMLLCNHTKQELAPDVLLKEMNRDLLRNILQGYYLTAFWGIFDPNDNVFTYSRAGHPKPLHISTNQESATLESSGTFIGIIDEPKYEQRSVRLRKGDRLYFFTDGIYEIIGQNKTPEDGILGYRKFLSILEECNKMPFERILPSISEHLSRFTYEDDYTLIVAEVTQDLSGTNPA